ncbi:MAG: hypothetical protein AUJ48_00840 [Deltaproteobacteria bacterium CG1_02_45_11]|nr:MAG: hypothetical protein AUJ48_00840 [Deltaproteobacteria bacterium CG1_02_45_11]
MKLFEPIKIGNKEIKNRIVMSPMTNHFADNGFVTERMIEFYKTRARGGAGVITVEDGIIDYPIGNNCENPVSIDNDKYIPMLKKLSTAIKDQGAVPVLQLSHAGRRAGRLSRATGCLEVTRNRLPVAPSVLAHPSPGHVVPVPLRVEEIQSIIEKFGQAAKRAAAAGFEMIGIHCAHMYLCGQFLSPWANQRKDMYGGSLENRLRFVLEIIQRIQDKVGDDFPLICRMNGEEPEGGNSLAEIQEISRQFEKAGVNALHISVGFGTVLWEKDFIPAEASTGMPEGCIVHLAENIKQVVSIPVIAVNKIRHVDFAEKVLQENRADMIALGRALLADPQWPQKALENRPKEIRPCISCCQGCVKNLIDGLPITCLINPHLGREKEIKIDPVPTEDSKNILIIGGGPGGLKTATTAAKRGHKVTLWEKENRLGGLMHLAQKSRRKKEIQEIIDYFDTQLHQLGVAVVLNREAEAQKIMEFNPDVLVLATGSKPLIPDIKGINKVDLKTAPEVLRNDLEVGPKVVIIGGGLVGLETAEYLAEKGKEVTVIEMLADVALDMVITTKIPLILKLQDYGVSMLTMARAKEITPDGVLIEYNGQDKAIRGDTVILAAGSRPDNKLYNELKNKIQSLYSVGDCRQPGDMLSAIAEGFNVGLKI